MPWIASLNVHYQLGVDGLSVLFLPATALLFLGSLVARWNLAHDSPRLHFSLLLLLQGATLGIFCALDTVLFFCLLGTDADAALFPACPLAAWAAGSGRAPPAVTS